jgi:intraflagellar transport protein 122
MQLNIPDSWQEEIDMANLKCRSKPFSDKEGIHQICNRCMTNSPLVGLKDDCCTGCGSLFQRNMIDFETLPLVEFLVPQNMPYKRVLELLRQDPPDDGLQNKRKPPPKRQFGGDGWEENSMGNEQMLVFNNQGDDEGPDFFTQKVLEQIEGQLNPENPQPVKVDEKLLIQMRYEEVFIIDYTKLCPAMPRRFFKNMVSDIQVTVCENCCKFFLQDDYEFSYIEHGHCPFCKHVVKDKGIKNVYGSLADIS